jgi:hypothetical protein
MKHYRYLIIILFGLFCYAIYKSETKRLVTTENKIDTAKFNVTRNDSLNVKVRNKVKSKIKSAKPKIYVSQISGDTLDVSKGKFIMILADRFKDKNITYGVSIWQDEYTCAWTSGTLKISILDEKFKILKKSIVNINKELEGSCQQLEELNIYMGDLIYKSKYINAEFTDDNGNTYYQWRKKLGEIY